LGYILLRNPEAGGFSGSELWVRAAACAGGFALLWLLSPLMAFAFNDSWSSPSLVSQAVAVVLLILAGAGISFLAFELDYLLGLVHSVSFVALCTVMRLIAGLSAVPGMGRPEGATPPAPQVFGLHDLTPSWSWAQSGGWATGLVSWMDLLSS
jgi:hypothetical protein